MTPDFLQMINPDVQYMMSP